VLEANGQIVDGRGKFHVRGEVVLLPRVGPDVEQLHHAGGGRDAKGLPSACAV
jgi:hypothetical protein